MTTSCSSLVTNTNTGEHPGNCWWQHLHGSELRADGAENVPVSFQHQSKVVITETLVFVYDEHPGQNCLQASVLLQTKLIQ